MDVNVSIEVEGADVGPEEELIIEMYSGLIETYLRKNADYGASYVRSAAINCYLDHGEVREDLLLEYIAEQVWVRMLDKQSRTHELLMSDGIDEARIEDESVDDTLLDWANYCVLLAAQVRMYTDDEHEFAAEYATAIENELDGDSR